jgi:hypothetical protein
MINFVGWGLPQHSSIPAIIGSVIFVAGAVAIQGSKKKRVDGAE